MLERASDDVSPQTASIVSLTQRLVQTPSRGTIDSPEPALRLICDWLMSNGVVTRILVDSTGHSVATVGEICSQEPGPTLVLDACIDTAAFGDLDAWDDSPTSGLVRDGWLYGRGSSDSKVAVSIFSHLLVEFSRVGLARGRLVVLFDADEHSGRFGGVKTFIEDQGSIDGAMIGYPGNYGVVAGARGFYRVDVLVYGRAMHSGGTKPAENAVVKAARVVEELAQVSLPDETAADFSFGPRVTVTQVRGGEGFSSVPDICEVKVDVRLTPTFDAAWASKLIESVVRRVDGDFPSRRRSEIRLVETWPPYKLADSSRLVSSLKTAGQRNLGRELPAVVCGPSNIGNFLAAHGIEATAGFGVTYRNLHAPDEAIDLATIAPVYMVYRDAVSEFLSDFE